jgi:hypothetical protein
MLELGCGLIVQRRAGNGEPQIGNGAEAPLLGHYQITRSNRPLALELGSQECRVF